MLRIIADLLQANLLKDFSLDCDLAGYEYSFLLDTFGCVLRPDLCAYSLSSKKIFLLERAARNRKLAKYEELVKNMKSKEFDVKLESIEVGSRGIVSIAPFSIIDDFTVVTDREVTSFFRICM